MSPLAQRLPELLCSTGFIRSKRGASGEFIQQRPEGGNRADGSRFHAAAHLHFELRGQGGIALDPLNWLKRR